MISTKNIINMIKNDAILFIDSNALMDENFSDKLKNLVDQTNKIEISKNIKILDRQIQEIKNISKEGNDNRKKFLARDALRKIDTIKNHITIVNSIKYTKRYIPYVDDVIIKVISKMNNLEVILITNDIELGILATKLSEIKKIKIVKPKDVFIEVPKLQKVIQNCVFVSVWTGIALGAGAILKMAANSSED